MEEMRKVALAYYANCTYEFKQEARDSFKEIDNDGDGRIGKYEFIEFLKKKDMQSLLNNRKLFAELDRNGDGFLDFEEALVYFYIGNFARFWCDNCGQHLRTTYFTCPDCFLEAQCYDLCVACYGSKRFDHEHRSFVDNHVMLCAVRTELQEQLSVNENSYEGGNRSNGRNTGTSNRQLQTSSSNGRSRKRDKLAVVINLVELGSALASCPIM